MRITFTQNHKVQQGDGKGPLYEAGKTYSFDGLIAETYARKYVGRGYAVLAAEEAKPARARKGQPAEPPVESIEILRHEKDGEVRFYAKAEWPVRTRITFSLLGDLPGEVFTPSSDRQKIDIAVANGLATYKVLRSEGDYIVCELIEGTFEQPPAL